MQTRLPRSSKEWEGGHSRPARRCATLSRFRPRGSIAAASESGFVTLKSDSRAARAPGRASVGRGSAWKDCGCLCLLLGPGLRKPAPPWLSRLSAPKRTGTEVSKEDPLSPHPLRGGGRRRAAPARARNVPAPLLHLSAVLRARRPGERSSKMRIPGAAPLPFSAPSPNDRASWWKCVSPDLL